MVETSCVQPLRVIHKNHKQKSTRTRGLFCSSIFVLCVYLAFVQDSGSAQKDDHPLQASSAEHVSSVGANNGVLNEEDENSDGSGSEDLEGEGGEEDEYSDEDECSSHHSVAEHNDVIASGAEADEASGANEEAEKEELLDMSKVSAPDGGDFMCPAPPCDSQESQAEVDQDSGLVLFQYFCAVRVPGFRAGLRLGAERLPSPPSLRCGACVERWRQQRRPQRRG